MKSSKMDLIESRKEFSSIFEKLKDVNRDPEWLKYRSWLQPIISIHYGVSFEKFIGKTSNPNLSDEEISRLREKFGGDDVHLNNMLVDRCENNNTMYELLMHIYSYSS